MPASLARGMACRAASMAASSSRGVAPSGERARWGAACSRSALAPVPSLAPNNWRSSVASFCGLTGLVRKSFMPATMQRSRVSWKPSAVMATMGTVDLDGCGRARMARVAATPSITGMCRSINTRSKLASRAAVTAASPLVANCAWWPMLSSSAAMYWRLTGWSSATSTRSARPGGAAAGWAWGAVSAGPGAGFSGRRSVKLLPSPTRLVTVMSPCIRRARLREISRPRPVPGWRRERELSPCTKRVNRLPSVASSMPMPVSTTANSNSWSPLCPPGRSRTSSTTAPRSLNLMALDSRLNRICLSRVGSASTRSGTAGSASKCRARALALACGLIRASTSRSSVRRSTGTGASVRRPLSSCDMSSRSFRMASRWSADSVAVRR